MRASVLLLALATLACAHAPAAAGASGTDAGEQSADVEWVGERPGFIRDIRFTDTPLPADDPSAPPTSGDDGQWWLVVSVDGAPAGRRLCARWPTVEQPQGVDDCQALPEGAGQVVFRPWVPMAELRVEHGETSTLIARVWPVIEPAAGPPPEHMPGMPTFPWPPPMPTSRAPLARHLLARRADATLGTVARHLETALAGLGYSERSYYAVPGGFALATRLEQIAPDGTPSTGAQRWSAALPPQPVFSLGDYLRALFTAPQGDYRVIVFVVTDQAFAPLPRAASEGEAQGWLGGGSDRLPAALAARPFTRATSGSALVYQFRKVGHHAPPIANPDGAAPAASQLDRSGITAALRQ